MGGDNMAFGVSEAASALRWWLEAGVDTAVQDAPRDWLKAAPVAVPASPAAMAAASASAASAVREEPHPETLDLFRDWLASAAALPLADHGARRVMPHGGEGAPVMLIAETPTSEDAAAGRPIAGDAWRLMERMLAAIGIAADDAYSASLSCFHAPGAKLADGDLVACAAIARRHITLAMPQRLLLLGGAPARALLGKSLAEARGHVHKVEGVRTVVTVHPRLLLAQTSNKALAWRDLLLLMEEDA
jgi:uracil-DNA glycosylase family 4